MRGDGGGDGVVRGKDGAGAGFVVAFGRRGQRHEVDGFESRRRGAVDAVGKEGDAVSGADEGTDDVLYVDGRAFVAIDGDAGVGAEVGDVFFHVGFAVGFTYAVAGGVYVYWEGCRFANFHPPPRVPLKKASAFFKGSPVPPPLRTLRVLRGRGLAGGEGGILFLPRDAFFDVFA